MPPTQDPHHPGPLLPPPPNPPHREKREKSKKGRQGQQGQKGREETSKTAPTGFPSPGEGGGEGAGEGTGVRVLALASLLLLAGCILQILAGYSHPDLSGHAWGSDDAYISYRYSQHLASGQGLVFNPGERVEGFSNLLYVLLLAPAAALVPADRLYAVSAGLNVLFALVTLIVLHRFARRRLGPPAAGALALVIALCPPLWVWVASGLETPLVLLLQIAVWVLVERTVEEKEEGESHAPSILGGLCLIAALCVLVRVDGF